MTSNKPGGSLTRPFDRLVLQLHALALATRDPRTPWLARLVVFLVVSYALSPIDLIPDVIPLLGYLDDLLLVPLGVALAIKLIPPAVLADCQARAAAAPARPVSYFGAALIITCWLTIAVGLVWYWWR
jgi:uncharacterized membrane protein YkvA (DUF1232 family)